MSEQENSGYIGNPSKEHGVLPAVQDFFLENTFHRRVQFFFVRFLCIAHLKTKICFFTLLQVLQTCITDLLENKTVLEFTDQENYGGYKFISYHHKELRGKN